MSDLNETHDAAFRSWVASANAEGTDFPIQNLPFGVFRRRGTQEAFRIGVAIGDQILDMKAAVKAGVFLSAAAEATTGDSLNAFMALGRPAWSALRLDLSRALRVGAGRMSRQEVAKRFHLLGGGGNRGQNQQRKGDVKQFHGVFSLG